MVVTMPEAALELENPGKLPRVMPEDPVELNSLSKLDAPPATAVVPWALQGSSAPEPAGADEKGHQHRRRVLETKARSRASHRPLVLVRDIAFVSAELSRWLR